MAKKNDIRQDERVDAIAIKRAGAAAIARELAGLSPEQQAEYWRRKSEEFEHRHTRPEGAKRASA
ncbi:MAG: hypothetical protein R3B68_11815 [Phycisphaerales bacterium]